MARDPFDEDLTTGRAAILGAEVQLLGTLCGEQSSHEKRLELAQILEHYEFVEPEHRVVFESIRALLPRNRVSAPRLAVHLNNRGFPSVELEKYVAVALPDLQMALKLARRLRAFRSEPQPDVR